MSIFYPGYIQIVERTEKGWFQTQAETIFNLSGRPFDPLNREKGHGLTKEQIVTELFRKYHGKLGYYIIHLPKREYHYCGTSDRDIQEKLWELGITRPDPNELS